ncbi:oxidoreductase [Gallaecimonas xiamenensis]|uniref:Flagellin modification protein A n=1 Tax=Gallaecimonas xiamenensis 3-C-1 TaxID=745411 RepID=K2KDP9_9GAMM|nr:oxidoreductase [Gallaecimonas xiamenensis]EKE75435.1 flagellin modification protein A [Gallaecimonas xiamenensis 3-C-1]
MQLANKTVLVAGAGGLLGSHLVKALLDAGAKVLAADLDVTLLASKLGRLGVDNASAMLELRALDITQEGDVKALFASADLDGAVNTTYPRNSRYGAHFFDVSLDSFNENLSLHLGSAFLFTQQCAAYFQARQRPFSLVNLSSIYGVIAPRFSVYEDTPMTMPVEYAAIKSAIVHLTKYVVAYVKDSRFRANSVSPGGLRDGQPPAFLAAYQGQSHGKGMLDVDDILGSILFLLSDASAYVTGQNLTIDDGFSL